MNLGKRCINLQEMPRKQDMGRSEKDFDGRHFYIIVCGLSCQPGDGAHRFWLLINLEKDDLTS